MPLKRQSTANGKCQATTKAGSQCAAPAVCGGVYCALHSDPERAAQLGRKGGRKNRRFPSATQELPERPLRSVREVTELLGETINQVRVGRLDPRVANTVGYLATATLKALQQGDIEARLRAIEEVLTPQHPN
jgi:hypothetical protein